MANNPFMPGQTQMPFATTPAGPVNPAPQAPNAPLPGAGASNNMSFDVDLTDIDSGFTVPDGEYEVACIDVDQGVSNAGNPQIIWSFAIVNGEYAGKEFRMYTAMTPAAMWKVAEVVTALGVGVVGQKVRFVRSDVLNRRAIATMEKSTYKGVERSSILSVRPINGGK